jgi:hypothetical protein
MKRGTLFWGIVLILIGVLLLIGNLFDINVWGLIGPLFLILLGAWILWGAFFAKPSVEAEEVTIPLESAARARIRVNHGAGRLRVDSSAGPGELVSGSFGGGLDHRLRQDGEALDVKMRLPTDIFPNLFFPGMWGTGHTLDWTFGLSSEIPLALDFDTGAGEAQLDLSDLQVTDLRLDTGASSTNLTLPANAGHTRVKISAGAASITVRVPSGVAARIRAAGGLSSINIDRDRFPREGGVYRSPDYDTAENRVDLDIDTGVGSINVR